MLNRLVTRYPLLPAGAILIAVVLLIAAGFGIYRVAFPVPTSAPPTVVVLAPSPSLTPSRTSTATVTLTPRPTWTLRPSDTATVTPTSSSTPTPTLLPTLNNANPLRFNDLYLLKEWSADQAANLADLMESYPNSRFPKPEDRTKPEFYASYEPAVVALREALLRYPEDARATLWRWRLAYDYALTGNPKAGAAYADIVNSALNSNEATIETLQEWFNENEKRLELTVQPLTNFSDSISSYLVQISGNGAVTLGIVKTPSGFKVDLLTSRFNFADDIESVVNIQELTGDKVREVVIWYSPPIGSFILNDPQVFTIFPEAPGQLALTTVEPINIGTEYKIQGVSENPLTINVVAFPACPVTISRSYTLKEGELQSQPPVFSLAPDPELISECEAVIDHSEQYWGASVSAGLMGQLEPFWPPAQNILATPMPSDALDQFRYRKAVFYALAGNRGAAVRAFNQVIDAPSDPISRWAQLSRDFLAGYDSQLDLYRLCSESPECSPRLALQSVIAAVPAEEYSSLPTRLDDFGITVRSSGVFDFENDGLPERWVLVQHNPQEKLEFWILATAPQGNRALFVDITENPAPQPRYREPVEDPPVVQLELHKGFILERSPLTAEPYITYVDVEFVPTTYTLTVLNQAQEDLLSGEDPALVNETLKALQADPRFNCLNYRICARFYYILGLSYELSGQTREAIDTYIQLWWEQKASLYNVMGRSKLLQNPKVTATPPTATRTVTPTGPTPTPGSTATVTPTGPSPTPTSTATASATP
jgi:hypothetical protein